MACNVCLFVKTANLDASKKLIPDNVQARKKILCTTEQITNSTTTDVWDNGWKTRFATISKNCFDLLDVQLLSQVESYEPSGKRNLNCAMVTTMCGYLSLIGICKRDTTFSELVAGKTNRGSIVCPKWASWPFTSIDLQKARQSRAMRAEKQTQKSSQQSDS